MHTGKGALCVRSLMQPLRNARALTCGVQRPPELRDDRARMQGLLERAGAVDTGFLWTSWLKILSSVLPCLAA